MSKELRPKSIHPLWAILNVIQAILIFSLMAIPGILGTLLVLLFRSPKPGLFLAKYAFCYPVFALAFSKLKVIGSQDINWKKTYFFVSNHESLFDIPAIFVGAKRYLYFLTKIELKKTPFVGWLGQAAGMVFIDRKNSEAAKLSISQAGKEMKKGKNILSFAEGTRTKTGEVGQFRKGSFLIPLENEVEIIPIGVSGIREILPSGSFRLRPGKAVVCFGNPISMSGFDKSKPELVANYVREKVIELKNKAETARL
ncbi:MAG: lysophospholipid acyltransferase family protein [Bacteroidota bacterium]